MDAWTCRGRSRSTRAGITVTGWQDYASWFLLNSAHGKIFHAFIMCNHINSQYQSESRPTIAKHVIRGKTIVLQQAFLLAILGHQVIFWTWSFALQIAMQSPAPKATLRGVQSPPPCLEQSKKGKCRILNASHHLISSIYHNPVPPKKKVLLSW